MVINASCTNILKHRHYYLILLDFLSSLVLKNSIDRGNILKLSKFIDEALLNFSFDFFSSLYFCFVLALRFGAMVRKLVSPYHLLQSNDFDPH